ncbi:hypothetical protein HK096_002383 [Nowakowskiella sp. JEL0078]|nr:hypothetical protein HK096_002383 [Nowakowskiella sp. JEL0078]
MVSSFYIRSNSNDSIPVWTEKKSENEFVKGFSEYQESTYVLWDASGCCSEDTNPFFQILNALLGWRAVATLAEVCTYFGYWILIFFGIFLRKRANRRKECKRLEIESENEVNPQILVANIEPNQQVHDTPEALEVVVAKN